MTAKILFGLPVAQAIESETLSDARRFLLQEGRKPSLVVVLVGDNSASEIYVSRKREACERTGVNCRVIRKVNTAGLQQDLINLSEDDVVDGIILQLPLPGGESPTPYFPMIVSNKDVDVFSPNGVGLLDQGKFGWEPCTPAAVLRILKHYKIATEGRQMVIINRSWVVGRPLMGMSIHAGVDATVTICHDKTPCALTEAHCLSADIIVVAVGKPDFLTKNMVKEGQTIIDVGINRIGNRIVGDVASEVYDIVENITPVPKGVGVVTCAVLVKNVVSAAFSRVWHA